MTEWFTSPETTPKATCPSEPFAIFASKFPKGATFLELGSGSGNNIRWLKGRGYRAVGIDSAPEANAYYCMTIDEFFAGDKAFRPDCVGIDSAPEANAYYCMTIEANAYYCMTIDEFFAGDKAFRPDCIFDINTLCHVEDPPYEAIHAALKPGGKFFSIHPAEGTEVDMAGKGYTRIADIVTMRRLLERGFTRYTIHICTNWNGNTKINSWQIEADK